MISDPVGFDFVSAGTLPDLMDLLARWSPDIMADILNETVESLSGKHEDFLTGLLDSGRKAHQVIGDRDWATWKHRQDGAA